MDNLYRVVALSENMNGFGLRRIVIISKAGEAYAGLAPMVFCRQFGQGAYIWSPAGNVAEGMMRRGIECVERLPDAPPDVIREVFND